MALILMTLIITVQQNGIYCNTEHNIFTVFPNAVMLNIIVLGITVLSVVILNVVMLSVMMLC